MYRGLPSAGRDRLPVAAQAAEQVLCLPIYPALTEDDQARVIEAINGAAGKSPQCFYISCRHRNRLGDYQALQPCKEAELFGEGQVVSNNAPSVMNVISSRPVFMKKAGCPT